MTRRIAALVALPVLLGGFVAARTTSGGTPGYTVTDLGDGYGYAINDDGLVAGVATGDDGTSHAVVWDSATGRKTDLGIADSLASGINGDGVVVGSVQAGGVDSAFRWANGVRTDLGALSGDSESRATGINASGEICGWSSGGSSGTRAFVWSDGTMTAIDGLGGTGTVANAINDAGEVAGTSNVTGDPVVHELTTAHAFRWDADVGIGDLDDGTGDLGSEGLGLNGSGDVAGVSWSWSTGGYYEASAAFFRNGTTTLLNGVGGSFATAVNDATDAHGVQIVGSSAEDGPTLWELDGAGGVTATRLGDVGWPVAINASGQIVSNSGGRVLVLTPDSATPPPAPAVPGAPQDVQAQGGSESVTISWSAVATATGYAVRRATASGGPYVAIASGSAAASPFTDTTAPLGHVYSYVVTASNAAGESAPSGVASAAPLPFPPTDLTATAGKRSHKDRIVLRWTESASDDVAQYRVYRRDSAGDVLLATLAPTTTYAVTGLARNTTYSFVVTAVHAGGQESFASNVASATTMR